MGDTMVTARAFFPRAAAAAWQRNELSTPPEKATAAFPRNEMKSKRRWYFSSIDFSLIVSIVFLIEETAKSDKPLLPS
jgi:hypothetical protein